MKSIHTKLLNIQQQLKAPKNQYNSFAKYAYRSAEDILEALKPHLAKEKCVVTINDEIMLMSTRFYVKATATIVCVESNEQVSVSAYAREEESKKGQDGSQITGAASSYARKYALNGLFLIDDTKEADTQDNSQIDLEKVKSEIEKIDTIPKLKEYYEKKKGLGAEFANLVTTRKKEIMEDIPTIDIQSYENSQN